MIDYVWYAGYGSNLNSSRFYKYITGGIFNLTGRNHPGCRNNSSPVKESRCTIDHELYFSKKSSSWENKAVAFLKSKPNKDYATKCMLYLVTSEQFTDILIQENGLTPPKPDIVLDLEGSRNGKEIMIGKPEQYRWYGKLLFLGEKEGYPIFSFTSKDSDDSIQVAKPGPNYLQVIGSGLVKNFEMSSNEATSYLMQQKGIAESDWTYERIENLLKEEP